MSLRKGDRRKSGQKHQNTRPYRNDLHDTSRRTKDINATPVSGICERCKAKIEWKIQYGKYKPLTAPRRCTVCNEKTVRFAYHIICSDCSLHHEICGKCGKKEAVIGYPGLSPTETAREEEQLRQALRHMKEREKRAFLRQSDRDRGQKRCTSKNVRWELSATGSGTDTILSDRQIDVESGDEESVDVDVSSTDAINDDAGLTKERETIGECHSGVVCSGDDRDSPSE